MIRRLHKPAPARVWALGILSCALCIFSDKIIAQSLTTPTDDAIDNSVPISPGQIGPNLQRVAQGSGDRFFRTDSQRMSITGVLTIDGSDSPVQVVRELSGKTRIQIGGVKGKIVIFSGKVVGLSGGGPPTPQDLDLLDSLAEDREDYFFFKVASGAGMRFLGDYFRTDDGSNPSYTGPFFDIYDLITDDTVRAESAVWKRYYFDSVSGLLQRVAYKLKATGDTLHETRLENWQKQNEQFLPGLVTHVESGKTVFSLRIDSVAFGPSVKDDAFTLP